MHPCSKAREDRGTGGRRREVTSLVFKIAIPWFTIRLIPIYHPITTDLDLWKCNDERAPIWTPDFDTFDLDGHVHACVDGAPVFRYVPGYPPIFPLPVRTTVPSRQDDVPECASRYTCFPRLLPQLFLMCHYLSLALRLLLLKRESSILNRGMSFCRLDVYDRLQRVGVEQ